MSGKGEAPRASAWQGAPRDDAFASAANLAAVSDIRRGSQKQQREKLIECSDLPATHRAVFSKMNDKAIFETGEIVPRFALSLAELVKKTGLSEQTCRLALANLARHRYFVARWPNPGRGQKATEGTLIPEGQNAITACPADCPDRSMAQRRGARKAHPCAHPKAHPFEAQKGWSQSTPFLGQKGVLSSRVSADQPPVSTEVLINEVKVPTEACSTSLAEVWPEVHKPDPGLRSVDLTAADEETAEQTAAEVAGICPVCSWPFDACGHEINCLEGAG